MRLRHRRAHVAIWAVLALLLPGVLAAAAVLRFGAPEAEAPRRIAPP
jgi:hypothetical protein